MWKHKWYWTSAILFWLLVCLSIWFTVQEHGFSWMLPIRITLFFGTSVWYGYELRGIEQ